MGFFSHLTGEKFAIYLYKHYTILLYGSENWALTKTDIRKIKAAEMWSLRRMEKVKWIEKITNGEVLNKTIQKKTTCQTFRICKFFFGHIMRKDKPEYLAVTNKIVGQRACDRRRMLFTAQRVKWANCERTITF